MRKRFWINRPLQLRILLFTAILFCSVWAVLFFTVDESIVHLSEATRQVFLPVETLRQAIRLPFLFSGFLCLVAGCVLTLLWSHRFVGPLKVVENALRNIAEGNLDFEIQSRNTDALAELIRILKKTQEALKARLRK